MSRVRFESCVASGWVLFLPRIEENALKIATLLTQHLQELGLYRALSQALVSSAQVDLRMFDRKPVGRLSR